MSTDYSSQAGRDRLELILAVLFDEAPHALEGRTYVQKLTFLLQQEADIRGFVFEPYDYGPFSRDLYSTLDYLIENDYVTEREEERDSEQTTLLTDGGRDTAEAALEFECRNCRSETTEFDDCPVCGAAPHKGEGYRIKCLDCGSIAFGDWGADVQHDMWHHREHYCPDAEFEVSALE